LFPSVTSAAGYPAFLASRPRHEGTPIIGSAPAIGKQISIRLGMSRYWAVSQITPTLSRDGPPRTDSEILQISPVAMLQQQGHAKSKPIGQSISLA
jgi:hypothetical protein